MKARESLEEENRKIRYLRTVIDLTAATLRPGSLTKTEAFRKNNKRTAGY